MTITVKASGILADHIPGGEMTVQPTQETSLAALVAELPLPPDLPCMTSVNNTLIPKDRRAATMLSDGDEVVVMPPLKGG